MNDKLENEKELPKSALAKCLTAIAIGRYYGITALRTNSILAELGWMEKGPKGWVITELGKKSGGIQSEVKRSGASYVIWPTAILGNKALIARIREIIR